MQRPARGDTVSPATVGFQRYFELAGQPAAIASLDDGRWLQGNAVLAAVLGPAPGGVGGRSPVDHTVAADRPSVVAALQALQTGALAEVELVLGHLGPAGEVRRVRWTVVADHQQRLAYWYGAEPVAPATPESARHFREIALELQQSLLPRALPHLTTVQLAARYQPATSGLAVGGDWYDAIELDGGRVLVMVGDVVGHGVRSAAAMGRLSAAAHALAPTYDDPALLLSQLDRLARDDRAAYLTTAVAMVIDPAEELLHYSLAGHPPPLIRYRVDGTVNALDAAVGPPLGSTSAARPVAAVRTRGAHRLVLYTDGLVERRGVLIDDRIAALARVLERAAPDAEACCDLIVGSMLDEGQRDDVAVLCAYVDPAT